MDVRILMRETPESRHENVANPTCTRYSQSADGSIAHARSDIHKMIDLAEDLLSLEQDALSSLRQLHLALCPIEESDAEFLLELTNLLAERRLTDMQPNCGTAKIQLFGYSHQIS